MPLSFMTIADKMTVAEEATKTFTVKGPKIVTTFNLFGIELNLTETVIVQWLVIAILLVFVLSITRKLQPIPKTKRQAFAEMIVEAVRGMVKDGMGASYGAYVPFIGALFSFSLLSSLMSLLGLRSPTADLSVTLAWGLISFFLIQYNRAKTGKFKGYFKAYLQPIFFMLPFNIIGEVANPVSLALRHFGNLAAGMVISGLIYFALGNFAIGVPAVLSLYFDLFSSVMQAYIFCVLTMSYVASAECE